MYRVWYIAGALIIWLIVYQSFFRYEYTMVDGNAVKRYDRLSGTTCGIPDCLPPTPTPVPKPTIFDATTSYHEWQLHFDHEARLAVQLVKKTEFGEELTHSPDAKKFVWTTEWADQVDGSLFVLHDPKSDHPLAMDPAYSESLHDPKYQVELVCFCNSGGSGYRWEVNVITKAIVYVNDDPKLEKKYGLVDTK
jgi:hypothetical protein